MAAVNFPSFAGIAECNAMVEQLQGRVPMTEANTTTETYLVGMRTDPRLINDMRRADWNQQQKASRAASWVTEHLALAAPRTLGLWLINKTCIDGLRAEIMHNRYAEITVAATARYNSDATLITDLELYRVASTTFRTNVERFLPYNVFRDVAGAVHQRMEVSRSVLGGMNDMLTSIVTKRNGRLGNDGNQQRVSTGAQHYDMYADYIMDPEETAAMMPLMKRTKGNRGTLMNAGELNEPDDTGIPKHGYLLLSTALKKHMQLNNLTAQDFAGDPRPMMAHALREVATMTEDGDNNQRVSDYAQQCANIDVIFNFYLTCRATGIFAGEGQVKPGEWRKMKKLNQGLYAIGQRLNSKEKVRQIIASAGGPLQVLMSRVNNTGSVHMPPFACTYRRIYDFVAVFGVMKYNDLRRTFFQSAVSPRYFVHYRVSSEIAMSIITYYWRCIEAMNETDLEVKNEAEHYFHQIMINKLTGYVNTTGKEGNVFNVTLHARNGIDPPRVIQQSIEQIMATARDINNAIAEDNNPDQNEL